jgi:hypothetical protein
MAIATFDTLKFANTLKAAGVPDKQAEAEAAAFAEVIQVNFKELATKDDLARLGSDLRHEMKEMEYRLNAKIDGQGARLDARINALDAKLDKSLSAIDGQFKLLRWMIGLTWTTCVLMIGILLRYLVFRGIP